MSRSHAMYFKDVTNLTEVDVYRICQLFGVGIKDPSGATSHSIKKLLLPGERGAGKSFYRDIKEARDTLERKLQMLAEDGDPDAEFVVPTAPTIKALAEQFGADTLDQAFDSGLAEYLAEAPVGDIPTLLERMRAAIREAVTPPGEWQEGLAAGGAIARNAGASLPAEIGKLDQRRDAWLAIAAVNALPRLLSIIDAQAADVHQCTDSLKALNYQVQQKMEEVELLQREVYELKLFKQPVIIGEASPALNELRKPGGVASLVHLPRIAPVEQYDAKDKAVHPEWSAEQEARMDVIGQNGNDGEHYDAIAKQEERKFQQEQAKQPIPAKAERRPDPIKPKTQAQQLPDTSALVDPTGKPEWSSVPAWANYLTQSAAGVWMAFKHEPYIRGSFWIRSRGDFAEINSGEVIGRWQESLATRPGFKK